MARTNASTKRAPINTQEGARAAHITAIQQLRRTVLSCLLWEKSFYEDGQTIAERIKTGVAAVRPTAVASLAIEARSKYHLRHVPLYLVAALAKHAAGTSLISDTLPLVIQRADELAEFLAIYAELNGVGPDRLKPKLSNQVRKGLARAFDKFNAYALAKYNRDHAIKLRDVLFLCHPKPRDFEQANLWRMLIGGTLAPPDTWETELSAGKDKKATFERLIGEGKLGYLALLRNLRGMVAAGVNETLLHDAILARKNGADRVLPFRYVAAARACPSLEAPLDEALLDALHTMPELPGRTIVMVDVSRSMDARLSARSDLTRCDAACTLASMISAERLRVFSFSDRAVEVPPRRGMAGVDAIRSSQTHNGTALFDAVAEVQDRTPHDRMIIITDEQANGPDVHGYRIQGVLRTMPAPVCQHAYVINVASEQNGVGYGPWTHLDGFSERVLVWIAEHEGIGHFTAPAEEVE